MLVTGRICPGDSVIGKEVTGLVVQTTDISCKTFPERSVFSVRYQNNPAKLITYVLDRAWDAHVVPREYYIWSTTSMEPEILQIMRGREIVIKC